MCYLSVPCLWDFYGRSIDLWYVVAVVRAAGFSIETPQTIAGGKEVTYAQFEA